MNTTTSDVESSQPPDRQSSSTEGIIFFHKPGYLLLITASTIFFSEVLVMVVLRYMPFLSSYQAAFVDATLLTIVIFPSLYFFIFKPQNQQIARRRRAESEKDTLIAELNMALSEVRTLQGIIPICAWCKKIRDDKGFWHQVEVYVSSHSDAIFSHGMCPECVDKHRRQ